MNVSIPIASTPARAATSTPAAPATLLPVAGTAQAATASGAGVSSAPLTPAQQFARAMQQIVRGAALTDAQALPSGDDVQEAPASTDASGADAQAEALPDLLLSGLLLQPQPPAPPAGPLLGVASGPAAVVAAAVIAPLALAPSTAASAQALPKPAASTTASAVSADPITPLPLAARATLPQDMLTATVTDHEAAPSAERSLPAASTVTGTFDPAARSTPSLSTGHTGLPTAAANEAHPLMTALGERIALHLQRGSERVVIRLDPPFSGHVEIQIRQDATGATQVQLSGSSPELVRQLQAISDGLRQELVQRQPGEVSVQVGHAMREHDGRQRQGEQSSGEEHAPGRALGDAQDDAASQDFALAFDTDRR